MPAGAAVCVCLSAGECVSGWLTHSLSHSLTRVFSTGAGASVLTESLVTQDVRRWRDQSPCGSFKIRWVCVCLLWSVCVCVCVLGEGWRLDFISFMKHSEIPHLHLIHRHRCSSSAKQHINELWARDLHLWHELCTRSWTLLTVFTCFCTVILNLEVCVCFLQARRKLELSLTLWLTCRMVKVTERNWTFIFPAALVQVCYIYYNESIIT